ncbi:MAG TPA: hypothetical protein VIL34_08950 [Actinopolymorphaceae bacterium]|jgi:hypothetical protein
MSSDDSRQDALDDVLADLVRNGTLSTEQARAVSDALRRKGFAQVVAREVEQPPRPARRLAAEIVSYVGGALVLGALILILGLSWDLLSRPAKVAICGGATVVLLLAGVAIAGLRPTAPGRRQAHASVLGALASAAAAFTIGVATGVRGFHDLILPGVVMAGVAAASYVVWRKAPALCAVALAGFLVIIGLLDLMPQAWPAQLVAGLAFVAYGVVWVVAGSRLAGTDRHVVTVLGGISGVVGTEVVSADEDYALVGLLVGVALIAGLFALFWANEMWWYAVLAVLGALVVPTTAFGVMFGDALVAGVVLLIVGVGLIFAGIATVRRQRTPRTRGAAVGGDAD